MINNQPHRAASSAADRHARWLAIVSGDRRGPAAALQRAVLAVLACLYRVGLAVGNLRFCCGCGVKRAPCPVVSVGNLTVGGTGKTPMVAYLARLISGLGGRTLIVSRGYGRGRGTGGDRASADINDEARELKLLCPGVPHVQDPDRAAAIRDSTATHPCDLAVLDDGFQHRRLARDLDIVLVDATRPFGYGRLLPRGLLREPLSALGRADLVVITRADLVAATDLDRLRQDISRFAAHDVPVLVARHQPTRILLMDGSDRELAWLRGRPIAAACGIGNPGAFRLTLAQLGADVRLFRAYDDHHAYTREDLRELLAAAQAAGAKTLVTTGKDSVKWRRLFEVEPAPAAAAVAAVEVALVITEGEEVLRRRIADLLARGKTLGDR